jgi:hypothetical protein
MLFFEKHMQHQTHRKESDYSTTAKDVKAVVKNSWYAIMTNNSMQI